VICDHRKRQKVAGGVSYEIDCFLNLEYLIDNTIYIPL